MIILIEILKELRHTIYLMFSRRFNSTRIFITLAAETGQLQLNVMEPLMAFGQFIWILPGFIDSHMPETAPSTVTPGRP
jgi:hypothetical protein